MPATLPTNCANSKKGGRPNFDSLLGDDLFELQRLALEVFDLIGSRLTRGITGEPLLAGFEECKSRSNTPSMKRPILFGCAGLKVRQMEPCA